jgi:hypothetical protein
MQKRFAVALGLTVASALYAAPPALAEAGSARGTPVRDLAAAGVMFSVITVALAWTVVAHRDGRISWLARVAAWSERRSGLPAWVAIPFALTLGALMMALFAFYWDLGRHIDFGRDPGPFGTTAHYPLLGGEFLLMCAGLSAITLGCDERVPTSLRFAPGWRVPVGGLLIFVCGTMSLVGYPLDDAQHALFGQDVTLWAPAHLLMLVPSTMGMFAAWILLVEGRRFLARVGQPEPRWLPVVVMGTAGGFLLGLTSVLGEWDYGVPQTQLVVQPILLMLAFGIALTAARVSLGRFGAIQVAVFYVVTRAVVAVFAGPIIGQTTPHFPLVVASAAVVELAAAGIGRDRPLTLGVVGGALIGTFGLAAEWGWSHVWSAIPWPASMLTQTAILGFAAAVAGGLLGAFLGRALMTGPALPQRAPRWLLPAAVVAAVACIAYPLPLTSGSPHSATLTLRDVHPAPKRTVQATVTLTPRNAADHAQWITANAWHGGGLHLVPLRRVAEGVYRTTAPIPVYGGWKSMVRVANGRTLMALPLYMPADPKIPAAAIPARAHMTRVFVKDRKVLQREAVGGALWLMTLGYLVVGVLGVAFILSLGWGAARLWRTLREESEALPDEVAAPPPAAPAPQAATAPAS